MEVWQVLVASAGTVPDVLDGKHVLDQRAAVVPHATPDPFLKVHQITQGCPDDLAIFQGFNSIVIQVFY